MKKISIVLLVLIVMVFMACSKKDVSSSDSDTLLTVWWWGEQEAPGLQVAMEEIGKMFDDADNGLKVELVLQESESLYPAFRTAAQSGQAPDIQFFWGGTQALEDVWLGNCLPLSDYMPQSELDQLPEDQAKETYWDGKQWGWPFYQLGNVFAYNKKMFADAGLDPENPPVTWDEFLFACEKLSDKGYMPLGLGAKDDYLGGWLVSYFGQQNWDSGADLIAMLKGETAPSDPKNIEWLVKIRDLMQMGYINEDVLSLDLYQGQDLFAAEEAAMTIHPQSLTASLERTMGSDVVGIMPQPSFGNGAFANSVAIPVQVFAISKDCEVPEQAVEFLKYLHTEEVMKLVYEKAAVVTPDKRFKKEWLTTNVDKDVEQWKEEGRPLYWMQYNYPFEYERIGVIPAVQKVLGDTSDSSVAEAAEMLDSALVNWRTLAPEQLEAYNKF